MAKLGEVRPRRASEAGARGAPFGLAGMPTFDPLLQASNRWLEGWMAVSSEILEFSRNRFETGIEISKAMAQSTSLNEAMDLQAKFTRSVMQDYFSEANKIVDLSARSFLDTLSSLQHQTHEAAEHAHQAEAAE